MRKEYLDWVDDEKTVVPVSFPEMKSFQGIDYYDYYAVNQWFSGDEYVFKLTWEECQGIIDMFDSHPSDISTKLSQQLLQYAQNDDSPK